MALAASSWVFIRQANSGNGTPNGNTIVLPPPKCVELRPHQQRLPMHVVRSSSSNSSNSTSTTSRLQGLDQELKEDHVANEKRAIERMEQYLELNQGSWIGAFTQYDIYGNVLARVPTKVNASVYGKGAHRSLYQTIYVKQAKSATTVTDDDEDEEKWLDFALADQDATWLAQRHKVGFFYDAKAYCLQHVTARLINVVLRTGILGEDDDEARDHFPGRNLKLPCRNPTIVNESCFFSESGNSRVRAYQVIDSKGVLDVFGLFHEHKDGTPADPIKDESLTGLDALMGEWSGPAVTQRSGSYGWTLGSEELVQFNVHKNDNNEISQVIKSASKQNNTPLVWEPQSRESFQWRGQNMDAAGSLSGNLLKLEDNLQTTFLPGGFALSLPSSVELCVKANHAFFIEFSSLDSPSRRRRLIRTYDTRGAVVSTTLCQETRS